MGHAGIALFTVGIITSICGAAKLPADKGGYPDTLPVFIFGFLLAIAGLIIWWWDVNDRRRVAADESSDFDSGPVALLLSVPQYLDGAPAALQC